MRHLELHILQSVPVACLNRDDFGSPKTALFGNVQRARRFQPVLEACRPAN